MWLEIEMDKYTKHLKRFRDGGVCKTDRPPSGDAAGTESDRTAIEKFYLPADSSGTVVAQQSWPTPAAPQKMTSPTSKSYAILQ